MGADMVGYMVRGPDTIDQTALDSAVREARLRVGALRECRRAFDAYVACAEGRTTDAAPIERILQEAEAKEAVAVALRRVPMYTQELTPISCGVVLDNWGWLVDDVADTDGGVEGAIKQFSDFWHHNTNPRDTVRRTFHDSDGSAFQVVFCGDMTAGDEPLGHGYQVMKIIEALDLYRVLGLQ